MAIDFVLASLNNFRYQWSIRFAVLLSLFFQAFLMLSAPLRRRKSKAYLKLSIWSAYQLADWSAKFAIAQISQSQSTKFAPPESRDFLTFWASFLLLHLGGPDTITAYTLDDNKFWKRHFFGLLSQVAIMSFVFLPFSQNKLLVPAILIFVVGVGKYAERTLAFYTAAKTITFSADVKKDVDKKDEGAKKAKEKAKEEAKYDKKDEEAKKAAPLPPIRRPLVSRRQFFEKLIKEKGNIKECFHRDTDAEDAYGFLCYEINKLYKRYFTKDPVIHTTWSYIFRAVCFAFYLIAFVLFTCFKKSGHSFDVGVTYTLLLGAATLDAFALARLIFSDEFFYKIIKADHTKGTDSLVNLLFGPKCISFLDRKKKRPKKFVGIKDVSVVLDILDTPIGHQPWSTSIYAYNLLSRCLKQRPRMISEFIFANDFLDTMYDISRSLSYFLGAVTFYFWSAIGAIGPKVIFDKLGLTEVFDTMIYSSKNPFTKSLWKLIYIELQEKSLVSGNLVLASLIKESRGQWVLFKTFLEDQENEIYKAARKCIYGLKYHESLLAWHIATEIYYNTSKSLDKNRAFSKMLSDYMCYLLVKYPQAIPQFEKDTYQKIVSKVDSYCAEIASNLRTGDGLEVACEYILDDHRGYKFDLIRRASDLARKLLKKESWNMVSKVWVEMLSYTAIHCSGDIFIQMISEGGELLNFVRECMVCFKLDPNPLEDGPKFQRNFKVMLNWTTEKEAAFVNTIKRMKEDRLIEERGLTSRDFHDLANSCSVSVFDIVLRVKFGNPRWF